MVSDKKYNKPRKTSRASRNPNGAQKAGVTTNHGISRLSRQFWRGLIDRLSVLRSWAWEHKYSFGTLWTLVVAAPPFFVIQYLQSEKFGAAFAHAMPTLAKAIDSDPIRWAIFAALWGLICTLVLDKIKDLLQARPAGWENSATILLKALDNIVGKKEQRFSRCLQETLQKNNDPADIVCASRVFEEITQPEIQVNEIIMSLHSAFSLLTRNESEVGGVLKVNLALLENGKIIGITFHYPNDHQVRSTVEELNSGKSTIHYAYKDGRICIIESIMDEAEKPNPRFLITDTSRAMEDGSLICYPIKLAAEGRSMVVSIFHSRRNFFKKRFTVAYTEALKPFGLRLKLEYSLLTLKELTKNAHNR